MSFILDALKKSESDRQRHTGPALFEVKIAPPRTRFPPWAVALIVLLVVNSIIIGWVLLRRGTSGSAEPPAVPAVSTQPAATNPSAVAALPPPAAAPSPAPSPIQQPPVQPGGQAVTTAPQAPPTQSAPAQSAAAAPAGAAAAPAESSAEPTLGAANRAQGAGESNTPNPDDYAPATDPGSSPLFKGHVRRGTESGYVLYQDAALVPGANLPPLRLDLHVYAARPQDRFALINMHKMHEGDSTPEGVRLENILPDGVVMSHNGQKFLLPRD